MKDYEIEHKGGRVYLRLVIPPSHRFKQTLREHGFKVCLNGKLCMATEDKSSWLQDYLARVQKEKRRKSAEPVVKDTLCWHCTKAYSGCSWSRSFVPVEGWTAIKTQHSYCVRSCPLFDPERRITKDTTDRLTQLVETMRKAGAI